jgi:competence protein ComEA
MLVVATPAQQGAPAPPAQAAEDPDTGLFVRKCSNCHDIKQIVSRRRGRTEWETVINKMIEQGLEGTGPEMETIFAYLNRTYGKVAINRAPADELIAVLAISQKDADAIVAYRKTAGPIADFDALKKIPGIDLALLEQKKEAIEF